MLLQGRAARAKVTQTWDLNSKSLASELGGYVMRGCAWQRQPGRGEAGKTGGSSWSHPPGALSALQGRTRVLPSVLKKNLPKEQRFLSVCRGGHVFKLPLPFSGFLACSTILVA